MDGRCVLTQCNSTRPLSCHLIVSDVNIFSSRAVQRRGEGRMGHVPSRRPSPSASTSGSNPPWRTWQIALATPAHSAAGVLAAWPGPAHQRPL